MEQNTHHKTKDESHNIIEGQLRECYGRVVYSHKTHEKCTDMLLSKLSTVKLIQIILSALTAGSVVTTLFGSGNIGTAVGLVCSTILLGINAYTKDYDLGEVAQKHKQAANELWLIREQYTSLITDLHIGKRALEDMMLERDRLAIALHAIYAGSPSTTSAAYKKAQIALQFNDEMTFSEKEIDLFLPKELRRNKTLS